jgi:cell division protein FtsW
MFEKIFDFFDFEKINKPLFFSFLLLFIIGIFTFGSASMGILGRNEIKFYGIIESQALAYLIGIVGFLFAYKIPYPIYYRLAIPIFISAIIICLLVLVPGIGVYHGGSIRWLNVFGFSLQPGEILKLATIIFMAYLIKKQVKFKKEFTSILFFAVCIVSTFTVMFIQKDLGTFLIIACIAFSIFFISNVNLKYFIGIVFVGIILIAGYVYFNPYVAKRIQTLLNGNSDALGASYQSRQSLIAVGNGGMFGRGVGKGVQKYNYLPEPAGDSIFATAAEEYGFFFSVLIISLFFWIIIKSITIAIQKDKLFAKGLIFGISSLILMQIFINIGSSIGIAPLSGDVLPLFSQGGTAIILNLFEFGLLLQLTKTKDYIKES